MWLLLSLVAAVHAQTFSIDWTTIDGGGGQSTGGVYSVTGTMGQPDAGTLSGGPFTLTGGFWSVIAAIQTPGAPYLHVLQTNGVVTVYWDRSATDCRLMETSVLRSQATLWSPVPGPYPSNATHFFITVPAPVRNRYYQLHKF